MQFDRHTGICIICNVVIFNPGQFWPLGIIFGCVCLCVWMSFQARITKLDQSYKRPWLRSLLFCAVINFYLQGHYYNPPPPPPRTMKYIGFTPSVCLSVRPSVRLSRLPCQLCNIYSSGWILSILATNDHYYGRVCRTQWQSSRSFGLDLENRVRAVASTVLNGFFLYLAQMITIIRGCVVCYKFCRICKYDFFGKFLKFFGLDLEKKSTILYGFFPYLAQMITSMRGCAAYNDLWPWPIFSRSFGLDLENRVRSVASTVQDGFFSYLVQMITSMRRCVACDDLWTWPISSRSFDLDFENHVCSVTFSVLDRLFPYLPQIITTIRGCVSW